MGGTRTEADRAGVRRRPRTARPALLLTASLLSLLPTADGQWVRRPDSRRAAYPTALPLPPPAHTRFDVMWERDLPGERIVRLAVTRRALVALTADGSLHALAASDGGRLWSRTGFDPHRGPLAEEDCLIAFREGGPVSLAPSTGDPVGSDAEACPSDSVPGDPVIAEGRELRALRRGRTRWRVRTGTDIGPPPLLLTTRPGPGSRQRPEDLVIVGTMDGILQAFRARNGHLAWTSRAAGRIDRPLAVWLDRDEDSPDQTRLILSGVGSRKLEVFRSLDGIPAGSLVLDPDSATILAGPVVSSRPDSPLPDRCYLAWSPYTPAGSRILCLRLSGVR